MWSDLKGHDVNGWSPCKVFFHCVKASVVWVRFQYRQYSYFMCKQ